MLNDNVKWIHMIGIGGVGMSGLAKVLMEMGYKVTGSDLHLTSVTKRLEKLGAKIYQGHSEENILQPDLLVYSSAIPPENRELCWAKQANVSLLKRGELLAELVNNRRGLVVAGTHGKTTTTSMVAVILEMAGLDPTIIIGGELEILHGNARYGRGEYIVAEADESDGSFLELSPHCAVVTNIESDHLDYYKSKEAVVEAFSEFMQKASRNGKVICYSDHPTVDSLLEQRIVHGSCLVTYGVNEGVDVKAECVQATSPDNVSFRVLYHGEEKGKVIVRIPGYHIVWNALAAISMALEIGLDFDLIRDALYSFRGVNRRFQVKGKEKGILVIDDYAHHPTEVKVTLAAARNSSKGRVIGVFQPHRYTRTRFLKEQFDDAFFQADILVITDIYAAGEEPIEGVSAQAIAEAVRANGHPCVEYIRSKKRIKEFLLSVVKEGDVVITMGAGDIDRVAGYFLRELRKGPVTDPKAIVTKWAEEAISRKLN